jgi:hypothetical protein
MKKAAIKTLRSERDSARKALEGLQRLKAVLPMIEAQREAIDGAIASIRFAWRSHKLENKIGDTLTIADYAAKIMSRLPQPTWRMVDGNKAMRAALRAGKKRGRRVAKK